MKYGLATNRVVATLSNAILAALVALTFSGVFAATASATETRSLTSSADSQIVENAPARNYGAATSLGVNGNYPSGSAKDEFALLQSRGQPDGRWARWSPRSLALAGRNFQYLGKARVGDRASPRLL
jgi:hypothetical protein